LNVIRRLSDRLDRIATIRTLIAVGLVFVPFSVLFTYVDVPLA